MPQIERILIANRGDGARRIAATVKEMGKTPVMLYAPDDKDCLHVKEASEAHETPSYRDIKGILGVAKRAEVDAIHPGWGFVSEDPNFQKACRRAGVLFIGPTEGSMRQIGNKENAKRIARKQGVPIIESSSRVKKSNIVEWAEENGLRNDEYSSPVMLKTAKSGGGSGNRIVYRMSDLEEEVEELSKSSSRLWGRSRVFAEKLVRDPRHIEVQVFGDEKGNYRHYGTRDCSIQYGNQKLIEEAPAPFLSREQRDLIHEYALAIARAVDYTSAGTAEFLMDQNGEFLFMEWNQRLQVEHGVTEMITNMDLVKLQILAAEGKRLPAQRSIGFRGSAIEARIDAMTVNKYEPEKLVATGGAIEKIVFPKGENIRVDHALEEGTDINLVYNRTQAKVLAWSEDRDDAIKSLDMALDDFRIDGVETTIPLLQAVLSNKRFIEGTHTTTFFNEMLKEMAQRRKLEKEMAAAIGASVAFALQNNQDNTYTEARQNSFDPWRLAGRLNQMRGFSSK